MIGDTDFTADEDFQNPLDHVVDILKNNNWVFNRMSEDKLMVKILGKHCAYRVYFNWRNDMCALQFSCAYDLTINKDNTARAAAAILSINERLCIGHFDLDANSYTPHFKHTSLLRGMPRESGHASIEDMVDIGLTLCEEYYSVFYLLSHANDAEDQNLSLALMQTEGEC